MCAAYLRNGCRYKYNHVALCHGDVLLLIHVAEYDALLFLYIVIICILSDQQPNMSLKLPAIFRISIFVCLMHDRSDTNTM